MHCQRQDAGAPNTLVDPDTPWHIALAQRLPLCKALPKNSPHIGSYRMGEGSNEWNRGYFGHGQSGSADAMAGAARRQSERLAEQQRQQDQAAARDADWARSHQRYVGNGQSTLPSSTSETFGGHRGDPATFSGAVRWFAVAGVLVSLVYAYGVLHVVDWPPLLLWAAKGLLAGLVVGAVAYALVVILRVAFAVLAVALKLGLWAAAIGGGLYWLSRVT